MADSPPLQLAVRRQRREEWEVVERMGILWLSFQFMLMPWHIVDIPFISSAFNKITAHGRWGQG